MKKIALITLLFSSIISPSLANDTFVINTDSIKQQAIAESHKRNLDFFSMFDTDGNGKLSPSECAGSFDNLDNFPIFTSTEISNLRAKTNNAFKTFDKDNDGYLNREETPAYISYLEDQTLSLMTSKMDINGDGQITNEEMLLYIQTLPSLEDSIKRLNEMTAKLQKK